MLEQKVEAEVLLQLDVSASGEVLSVEVVTPAGNGFDEAAIQAVRNFRFLPALNEAHQAVDARIQYLYRFTLETASVLSVEGRVIESGTRRPIGQARVILVQGDTQVVLETDDEGRWKAADLAPGEWNLVASGPGLRSETAKFKVVPGRVATARVFLHNDRPWAGGADEEIVVEGERLQPEVTERALKAEEVTVMPGSGGDIVRAVQSLPGVARPPFNAGQLMIRGTSPWDSGFFLGGSRIPIVFHFGGLSTVVNSRSLGEVGFLPGNFGARYGRVLGGVVDLRLDPSMPERSTGYVSVDLFQSTAFIQQKLGDRWALTVSGRRSYIDAVLAPIANQDPSVNIRLPAFWDVQTRLQHRSDNGTLFDSLLLISDDRFDVSQADPDAEGGFEESSYITQFWRMFHTLEFVHTKGWKSEHSLSYGSEQQVMEFQSEEEAWEIYNRWTLRSEAVRAVPKDGWVGWRFGVDIEGAKESFNFEVEDFGGYLPDYRGDEEGEENVVKPGVYMEQIQRSGIFEISLGARLDQMLVGDAYTTTAVDPRISSRISPWDSTDFKASVGRYSQFPLLREVLEDNGGNPELLPEWAVQASVGGEHRFNSEISLDVTVYQAWLVDLISGGEDRFEFFLGPPPTGPLDVGDYANEGTGTVRGLETLLKYETERTFAFVGTTLSRSVRTDRPGANEELFQYDQPLLITAVGSHELPRHWRLGTRLRYGSGNPYTPASNHIFDLVEHEWVPVFDQTELARMPPFFTLDFRVDKDWVFRRWKLGVYLDLMNATNRRNVELITWTLDFTEEIPVHGLPLVPAFGIRGEW